MKGLLFILTFLMSSPIIAEEAFDFVVAKDGSGNFLTVQEAIYSVPDIRKNQTLIYIKSGVYKEKLILPASKINVQLIGENNLNTVITYDDYADKLNRFGEKIGTSGSSSFYIYGNGFKAKNLTFKNSSGDVGQAVAVRIDADRVMFENCRFLGFQDTLYPHGKNSRQYYLNCYIEGATDFIFGWSTAVFDQCEIYSRKGGKYITAASTQEDTKYGFVFIDCRLTGDADKNSVYLGRPWRDFAKTVFIRCDMGQHIHKSGWHNWNKPNAESTVFYAEYKSKGEGANALSRAAWTHQLEDEKIVEYDFEKIFNGWNPML